MIKFAGLGAVQEGGPFPGRELQYGSGPALFGVADSDAAAGGARDLHTVVATTGAAGLAPVGERGRLSGHVGGTSLWSGSAFAAWIRNSRLSFIGSAASRSLPYNSSYCRTASSSVSTRSSVTVSTVTTVGSFGSGKVEGEIAEHGT